ncbi:MAG: hypothetical protein A2148_08580 [Chloroflexi bacterium RBG_16_68_14]|nr:MAG: hypothetical protein A2148_08580 [Chloroflexi bacterium RBG_16_68_14]
MSLLETNIFPITNLAELKSRYRLYRIRGLSADQEEYDPNIQTVIRKLSYSMRSPVAVTVQKGEPHLALQDDAPEPPSPYPLVRATAVFERTDEVFTLDYENPTPETDALRIRFLRFAIEGALFRNRNFWQPGAGNPFFERRPILDSDGVCVYRGYGVRVVPLEGGKLGVCIDVQHKYVSRDPLPANLKREDFRKYKNARCVYRYGNSWYEIKLHDHTGLSVSEQMLSHGVAKPIPLLEYIMDNAPKPLPREVADLSPTSPAVTYMTGRDEVRHAAAALCYPVFDTSDSRIKLTHRKTILPPHVRRQCIQAFVKDHLTAVRFKDMAVHVSITPVTTPTRVFLPPDLAFGNNTVYSVRGTPGTSYVSLEQLGQTRRDALFNCKIGPYAGKPLDLQYIILPKSVCDSHGPAFLKDLKRIMTELYTQELPYDPVPIVYDDLRPKTYAAQGRAILEAVEAELRAPGYGVAMIHETVDRRNREHDQLAAMVMRELRELGLYVSVIHTTVGKECYWLPQNAPAGTDYQPLRDKGGKLNGYLRNVAITKILLTNERWPFVLATPLHADLTVGIDVQLNTACFAFIGKSGSDIRTVLRTSTQKERLSRGQVRQTILEVLRQEADLGRKDIRRIVAQRDGQFFATEFAGINEAIATLKTEGVLPDEISVDFIEIPKKSAVPFRLFNISTRPGGQTLVENPQVGSYYIPTARDGYVCTTGREFFHPGTANPLHVKHVAGAMPFHEILEDVYALTCLAWTRPEDCTRHPVTLKLADIRLREHAGGYDEDALEYGDEPQSTEVGADE